MPCVATLLSAWFLVIRISQYPFLLWTYPSPCHVYSSCMSNVGATPLKIQAFHKLGGDNGGGDDDGNGCL